MGDGRADGSSHERRAIQRMIAGLGFLKDDEVVKLDVDTVDATELREVVRVWGTVCDGFSCVGAGWKEKLGVQGMTSVRDWVHTALTSMVDGGNVSAESSSGWARNSARTSGLPLTARLSARRDLLIMTQV